MPQKILKAAAEKTLEYDLEVTVHTVVGFAATNEISVRSAAIKHGFEQI